MNFEVLESGSYIGFKVVTKPMSDGYMLKNVASVFYDNTYAGTTNPVYCTIALTGINEMETAGTPFGLYPNPFSQEISLAYRFAAGDMIRVYHTSGQLVYEKEMQVENAVQTIDMSDMDQGIYIVQVLSSGRLLQRKCVKL
jgi:hypothetical protein